MTPLLRPEAVAKLLGVSRSTVYNLVAEGRLAAVRFMATSSKKGRDRFTVRISQEAVKEFIDHHSNDGRREAAG